MKFTMQPNSWDKVRKTLEEAGHELVDDIADAECMLFNGTPDELPEIPESLGFVQLHLAGVDAFVDQMKNSSTRWANAAGLYDKTVAESAIALLLAQLHAHKPSTQAATWLQKELEPKTRFLSDDSTVAIIGAGGIGQELISMLKGFGPEIIAVNRSGNPVDGADETVPSTELDAVWPRADFFVLLKPLTDETHHIVDADAFAKMKDSAVVVNVGRGPLVNTDDLVDALRNGVIAGAGLDVTEPEPLPDGHPLWEMSECVITPHLANPLYSVHDRIGAHMLKNMEAFANGETMPTEVDVEAGY